MSDTRLRNAVQQFFNGVDTGVVRLHSDWDETLANVMRELRAALAGPPEGGDTEKTNVD